MNDVIIPFNKSKIIKNFAGAVFFAIAGILFIVKPEWFIKSDDSGVIKIIGYATVLFFGAGAIILGKKLFDKKPGLIITKEKIVQNFSNGSGAETIFWKDINGFSQQEVQGQNFILIKVKNAEGYLQRENNPIKKRLKELNYKLYQTPFAISTSTLQMSSEDLYKILSKYNKS